jgi:hypothetical protein
MVHLSADMCPYLTGSSDRLIFTQTWPFDFFFVKLMPLWLISLYDQSVWLMAQVRRDVRQRVQRRDHDALLPVHVRQKHGPEPQHAPGAGLYKFLLV